MPTKKTKKIVKTVVKKIYKPNNKKIVNKFILSNKWRFVAIVFMLLFTAHLLFSYNFTIKRIVLKSSEFFGLSNQSHDFDGHNIFEVNGITYVAYDHPLVIAKVVVDPSCNTELCDVSSLKRQILTNLTPAIQFEEVVFDSQEGKRLMQEAGAKAVPAFVFDDNIKLLANFAFIEDFFIERPNYYLLKTPPGR
ncbi:MAG: hypothetical protein U1D98_01530, partial [Candidatus Gracilibacteria bacterium]|nr:hypothetical protein [Candidatus Gracilibacteria bacterium]